jgi:hypothetical protein
MHLLAFQRMKLRVIDATVPLHAVTPSHHHQKAPRYLPRQAGEALALDWQQTLVVTVALAWRDLPAGDAPARLDCV